MYLKYLLCLLPYRWVAIIVLVTSYAHSRTQPPIYLFYRLVRDGGRKAPGRESNEPPTPRVNRLVHHMDLISGPVSLLGSQA